MNQVLHIFRKDTRHLWVEIALSLAVYACLVCVTPYRWKQVPRSAQNEILILNAVLFLLVPLAWWLLTTRLVQSESLVGDRQFWLTRPYEWPKLVTAKILFLAAWVGLVYLAGQLIVLHAAGFASLMYLPALTARSAWLLLAVIGPVAAIASVSSNFARFLLTILGSLVLGLVYVFVRSTTRTTVVFVPVQDHTAWLLLLAGCSAAIGVQYASRRVWLARGLLVATAIALAILPLYSDRQATVDRFYPESGAVREELTATLAVTAKAPILARSWAKSDFLDLPIRFSGVQEGYAAAIENYRYRLTAEDGSSWTSSWQTMHEPVRPGTYSSELHLMMSPEVYQRFKGKPVTLEVTFALTRFRASRTMSASYPSRDTAMADVGYCSKREQFNSVLACRTPVKAPPMMYGTVEWTSGVCGAAARPEDTIAPAGGWLQSVGFFSALTSVHTSDWELDAGTDDESFPGRHWRICPGSPMTLTEYEWAGRTRATVTFPSVELPGQIEKTD